MIDYPNDSRINGRTYFPRGGGRRAPTLLDDQDRVADAGVYRIQGYQRLSGGFAFGGDVLAQHDPRVIVTRVFLRSHHIPQDFGENHFLLAQVVNLRPYRFDLLTSQGESCPSIAR